MKEPIPHQIRTLISQGALFFVNHSGGKDSQAMFDLIWQLVPRDQIVVVHAVLAGVEWEGVPQHIEATVRGHKVHYCSSRRGLLQMIEERGKFPSPSIRQCTSDLKRGPLERTIRQHTKATGQLLLVNCMGMRAEESPARKKLETFKHVPSKSLAGRSWFEWLPIHTWLEPEVFKAIELAGQQPHWAYAAGMTRLSCCFCIMASKADLTTAARLNPVLYKRYVELEKSTGQVMLMPSKKHGRQTLEQVTGVLAA